MTSKLLVAFVAMLAIMAPTGASPPTFERQDFVIGDFIEGDESTPWGPQFETAAIFTSPMYGANTYYAIIYTVGWSSPYLAFVYDNRQSAFLIVGAEFQNAQMARAWVSAYVGNLP